MAAGVKRKRTEGAPERAVTVAPKAARTASARAVADGSPPVPPDMEAQLQRIAASNRTPFEKKVWTLLCQIPRGRVSTYGLVSAQLGSSARAVGGALRRNPFAPQVPCHRVVAAGGGLGGFRGQRPRSGEGVTLDEKRRLLRAEGVRFDDRGRVLGTPWAAFV
ncbi:methylated-DNA--cysteine S-met [Durotheca rogersii]|uniref:methylated-DNA--cysteine S-met n=1 Tax=Durotheca rogersii TaxID=419775 RepID=UPI0022210E20|nr:methylated-DNA--cysteine S-met [Durotheca rogersii]KAI5864403.1 methylated-DNA--cysteine S-met [Durotheca rogersii]